MEKQIPESLVLKGKLITLRPPCEADFPAFQEILSDSKTMEFLKYLSHSDTGGWTLAQVKERYGLRAANQKNQKGLSFTVEINQSHKVAGNVGFNNIDLIHRNANYGRIIHHPYWGTGVADECNLLCFDYVFTTLKLHRIETETFVTNLRSRKTWERLGATLEGIRKEDFLEEGKFLDNCVYTLFENEWPAVKARLQERLSRSYAP